MSTEKQGNLLFKNLLSLGLVQIGNYVLPLISIPIIVRIIGPSNYGVISLCTSLAAYFVLLINYGFDYTATRVVVAERENQDKINHIFSDVFYSKLLLLVLSTIIFTVVIFNLDVLKNDRLTAVYAFLYSLSFVFTPNWIYQGMQDLQKVAVFNFLSKLFFTILVLVVIKQKDDYYWQPLALGITQIIVGIVSFFYAVKKYKITFMPMSWNAVKDLLWSGKIIFLSMLSINLFTDSNVFLLGLFESKQNVGYFSASWKLIFVFLMIVSYPISQALYPYIGTAFNKSKEAGVETLRKILPPIIYVALFSSIIIFFFSDIIIRLFYGNAFEPSIIIFRILTLVPLFSLMNTTLGVQALLNLKKDKVFFWISLFGGLFSIITNLIVIQVYGYVGCAWAWLFTEFFMALAAHIYLLKIGINVFSLEYLKPVNFYKSYVSPAFLLVKSKISKG